MDLTQRDRSPVKQNRCPSGSLPRIDDVRRDRSATSASTFVPGCRQYPMQRQERRPERHSGNWVTISIRALGLGRLQPWGPANVLVTARYWIHNIEQSSVIHISETGLVCVD